MWEEGGGVDAKPSRYLDGEMTEAEVDAFELELANDPALQVETEAIRQLDAIAREAGSPPPIDDARWQQCWSNIEERIEGAEARRKIVPMVPAGAEASRARSGGFAPRLVAVAAAALLTASVALYLLSDPGSGTPAAPAAGAGSEIAFIEAPGVNAFEVVEISSADGFQPSVVYPEDDSQPVLIMLHEL